MPIATLLLREDASTSLTTLVEKSQQRKPPLPEYDLTLTSNQLDLVLIRANNDPVIQSEESSAATTTTTTTPDEGFESDIDSLSIVSSDGSLQGGASKTTETDSANGSASSDSDTDSPPPPLSTSPAASARESYNLVDCVCYTDVKCPDVLVFVIKCEAFVFRFDVLNNLKNFYVNFSALKAVTNQKAYNKNLTNTNTKFNLLQITDNNGVTHIEITREPPDQQKHVFLGRQPRNHHDGAPQLTNIISLNAPDTNNNNNSEKERSRTLMIINNNESRSKNVNLRQRSESIFLNNNYNDRRFNTIQQQHSIKDAVVESNSHQNNIINDKFPSTDNILLDLSKQSQLVNNNEQLSTNPTLKKKIWNSAEDLLQTTPKRPERRNNIHNNKKGRAPQPPTITATTSTTLSTDRGEDILRGQYVRVNVSIDAIKDRFVAKSSQSKIDHQSNRNNKLQQHFTKYQPNLLLPSSSTHQTFISKCKYPDATKIIETPTYSRLRLATSSSNNNDKQHQQTGSNWTNSVPRILSKKYHQLQQQQSITQQKQLLRSNKIELQQQQQRAFTPMAYRYIDTTTMQNYTFPLSANNNINNHTTNSQTIGNRLFGLSSKLKDFSGNSGGGGSTIGDGSHNNGRWNSMSELNSNKFNSSHSENNLKSVIKKDENRKKNEKKVTFSAYTTVQVV